MIVGETKTRILDSARDLFLEGGSEAVSMRAVAARVGVTPMAIYRHFDNRSDLLSGVVAKGEALFLSYLQRAGTMKTAWERLEASGRAYMQFALEHPRDYALLFMEAVETASKAKPSWQSAATFRFLVDRVRENMQEGNLADGDAEEAALTIWAHVHGLVSLYLAGKLQLGKREFQRQFERSVEQLVRGFLSGR